MATISLPHGDGAKAVENAGRAADLKGKAARYAKGIMEDRKERLAGKADLLASALRQTAVQLEGQEDGKTMAGYFRGIAGKVEETSAYLRANDVEDLLGAARRQVRERPGLVLGGALIGGFVLARFLTGAGRAD